MNPSAAQQSSIQVCQPGFDIRDCPDWAYLFNSNWPSLAIAYEKTIPNPVGGPVTLTHNLGYPPLTIVYNNVGGTKTYGRTAAGLGVTSTTVVVGAVNGGTSLTVRCFNVDISKEQSYPLPQSAQAKLPYNNQFGIKQAKSGRLITSSNLNDFIIHSRAQSPAVLQVATTNGKYYTTTNPGSQYGGNWIAVPLQTSYIPWVYIATSGDNIHWGFETINGLEFANNKLILALIGNAYGSITVLRDPLFYPNTVSVVY